MLGLVVGPWLLANILEYRENRRWEREGSRTLREDPQVKVDMERYDAHLAARGVKKVRGAKPPQ